MVTIHKVAAILVVPKFAVYFKLNYFKLIYLQANMLSSFIFYLFCSEPYNLPQNCHSGLENTRFRTQTQCGCDILHPLQWCYTNLTNYDFLCKSLIHAIK